MKLNKISMMLAAAAFVGCSDDFSERSVELNPEASQLIQLSPDFMLAGVDAEGNATRTHWALDAEGKKLVNKFLPIYTTSFSSSEKLSDLVGSEGLEKVGLCWRGLGNDAQVYTNYEFYHYGWLNNDEADLVASCNDVYNGSLYSEIEMQAGSVGDEADPDNDFGTLPAKSQDGSGNDNLNYNSGIYKTDNKAIFGGDYIVYYPYNKDFKEVGLIPAYAGTEIKRSEAFDSPEIGKATFRYSEPINIAGGAQAGGFKLKNLSTLVQLRLASVKTVGGIPKFRNLLV